MNHNTAAVELFHIPGRGLCATVPGVKSCVGARPVFAAPQTRPGLHLCLLDGKGEEFAQVAEPTAELSAASQEALAQELRQRNLTARVAAILGARQEFGATYWSVQTDRGKRDFVTQNLNESTTWFGENRVLLQDVEGNRFEIDDLGALDARSRVLLEDIL